VQVINHLEKLFVTNDAATIVGELEVQHPAAKLLVMASNMQEVEVGDGTNLVVVLAGELLSNAEELLKSGLHVSEIIGGYKTAEAKALAMLDTLVCKTEPPETLHDAKARAKARARGAAPLARRRGRRDGRRERAARPATRRRAPTSARPLGCSDSPRPSLR
jgi:chaperonin GroEL (HSP60 family)